MMTDTIIMFETKTELGGQEWLNALFLRYGIDPPDLPTHYDGNNAKFSVCHSLYFNKGVLITTCHNKIFDEFTDLSGKSFTPSYVHNFPLIHYGRSVQDLKSQTAGSPTNNRS